MLALIHSLTTGFAALAWGPWLLALLLGGGAYFLLYSRLVPFQHLPHSIALLRGRYSSAADPGQISHFQTLSAAMSGTIGIGNIAGVALAIYLAGPGAIFWMWMTAILGIATKFFTCALAVMYRSRGDDGELHGGPMFVIKEALPKRWHFLAYGFAVVGLIGCLPAFQANQLVQILRDLVVIPSGWMAVDADPLPFNFGAGLVLAGIVSMVIFGGIKRIARVASALVPVMTLLYVGAALVALVQHLEQIPGLLALIVRDAFTGEAVAGGALLTVILVGVQRGAYSNEAGMGTESMAHGAVRTSEPIREGLVAMLGPILDTLIICTATALMILLSGVWLTTDDNGVTLTASAFSTLLGPAGTLIIFICVISFATTTMLTYSYYGSKCFGFLFGMRHQHWYRLFYVSMIVLAAMISLEAAVSLIDGAYALMAIPTMVSALLLAPKVKAAALVYFAKLSADATPR